MAKKAVKGAAKKKRAVSGKRGRPGRSKQQKSADPRGIIGIAVFCLGLLALVCQFVPSNGGFLNRCMLTVRGLGGILCLLLPVVLCWAGVTLVFFGEKKLNTRTLIYSTLIFLFVETMFQLFNLSNVNAALAADNAGMGYGAFLARSFSMSSLDCKGGGLIGALLAWPLHKALDVWGGVIVMICATAIVLMAMTGISFSGLGMRLSELLDDLRVEWQERREEKSALHDAQQEEELERENALALERQKRKQARMQQEKEEQLKVQKQEAQPEPEAPPAPEEITDAEPPKPQRQRRKEKPEFTVVRPQNDEEQPSDQPVLNSRPPRRAPAPRKRKEISPSAQLYIERDDEFTRTPIEEHTPTTQSRRNSFTMREAEDAFLYGMNPEDGQTGYAPQNSYAPQPAFVPPYQDDAPAQDNVPNWSVGEKYMPSVPTEPEQQPDEDDEASSITNAQAQGADRPIEESYQPDEPEEDEPELPAGSIEYDDGDALVTADVPHDEPAPALGGSFGGWQMPPRRESTSGVPSSYTDSAIDAARARTAQNAGYQPPQGLPVQPQGQDVLKAQRMNEQQTVVQLRGNRLDGTPIVMPKKDIHESPQAAKEEYIFPPIDLLNQSRTTQDPNQRAKDEAGARKLIGTLESFGVQAKLLHVTHGPAITRYELAPAPGVKVSRIVGLVDDIALNMASDGVRIEAPIPGKPAVGIEIPNQKIETVSLREVLESPEMMREKSPTAVALGKGISGAPVIADMAKMPHVLIAGATGSGKSVCINTIINSIIFRAKPEEVRLILIDPKVVELSVYNGIPHLLVPVVTDPKKASAALSWAVVEMEHRYKRFETMGVRDIRGYNNAIGANEEPMSKIIVIIDELADLMMVAPGEVEESICRLAQLARAAGIHLVIATQRPSVNVITGVIKANIPSRIAFAVSSQIDSRTILDSGGAEKLLGKGDMLYAPQGAGKPTRVQGCFVSDDEVQRIVEFVRGRHSADYNEDVIEQMNTAADEESTAASDAPSVGEPVDEMLNKAIELAVDAGQVSISMLQRRLRVGYARAGRLVDEMTLRGITAEAEGPTKPRTVLISREEWRRMQENQEQ